MRTYQQHWLKHGIAKDMRLNALRQGTYNGSPTIENQRLIKKCTARHLITGTTLVFTYDEGMHSCGWWKNPDYERCYHLSLSFFDPITLANVPHNKKIAKEWLDAFYGNDCNYIWAEPPYSNAGKEKDIWHYRLFCDINWKPILPRKEVYSTEFTPNSWISFSEINFE